MRPFLKSCNCGFLLKDLQAEEQASSTSNVRLAAIFQNKLRPNESHFFPLDPFEATLSALSIDAISKLIWTFGFKENADCHIGTGRSQQILRTQDALKCLERGYLRLKNFNSTTDSGDARKQLGMINLAGLKAFVRDAESVPDIRFAEWLAREIARRSDGKYSLGNFGQRQRPLF
jgi:hypothetical protein